MHIEKKNVSARVERRKKKKKKKMVMNDVVL